MGQMLHFVCVQAHNYCERGKEYTEKLYEMVGRNLAKGVEASFVCFTDDEEPYHEGITKRPLHGKLKGWWNIPYVFKDGHFDDDDQIVFMGLDTCIVGPLDDIITYKGDFALLRDIYHPDRWQNSVMMWRANTTNDIWELFENMGFPDDLPRGDQELIEIARKDKKPDILNDLFPGQFASFKVQASLGIPMGTSIVYFHGHPRPHEVIGNWVENVWKIGGGTIHSWRTVWNTDEKTIKDNIINSLSSGHEILSNQYKANDERPLIICGGGPSLKDNLHYIKAMQEGGAIVWALNNSFRYLCEHDISPHAQIILDARQENIEFVPEKTDALLLYSAQCHPSLFNKQAGKIIIWCPSIAGILDILAEKKMQAALISGGSTVGLKALGLAHLFGFSDIHLFGYDSSYRNGNNHAYAQPLNDNEQITEITVNDRKFTCAPWMATQTEEFRHAACNFVKMGMQITIYGDGLLPYVASLM
jgi:hypothetical protein